MCIVFLKSQACLSSITIFLFERAGAVHLRPCTLPPLPFPSSNQIWGLIGGVVGRIGEETAGWMAQSGASREHQRLLSTTDKLRQRRAAVWRERELVANTRGRFVQFRRCLRCSSFRVRHGRRPPMLFDWFVAGTLLFWFSKRTAFLHATAPYVLTLTVWVARVNGGVLARYVGCFLGRACDHVLQVRTSAAPPVRPCVGRSWVPVSIAVRSCIVSRGPHCVYDFLEHLQRRT